MLRSVTRTPSAPPSRRAFLSLGTLALTGVGLAGLTGCGASGGTAAAATTSANTELDDAAAEQAVKQALASVQALHTGATSLASRTLPSGATVRIPGATAKLLTRITEVHASQLTQLGSPAAEATPSATATSSTEISSPGALASAEWQTARTALGDAAGLTPQFALLLYRIAASCAANTDLLRVANHGKAFGTLTPATSTTDATTTPTVAPSNESQTPESPRTSIAPQKLTTDETDALNRLLAGEHAAFYAYPLVIAHIDAGRKAVAEILWEAHRQQRDELERLLIAAGVEPAEASAAYEVATPETTAKAGALATLVERRLSGLAVDVIAVAQDASVKSLAAGILVASTRRQAAWSNKPVTEPGT